MTALAALPALDRTGHGEPMLDTDPQRVVLVADDDVEFRYLAQAALDSSGFKGTVLFAGSGSETLRVLEHADTSPREALPDLILLDLFLPDVEGEDLLGEVKSNPHWSGIPIVVVTASCEPDTHQAALEAGASAVFSKPSSFRELVSTFRRLPKLWERSRTSRLPGVFEASQERDRDRAGFPGRDPFPMDSRETGAARVAPRSLPIRRWR
jgi:CheY-like chemotaxis protein